MIVKPLVSLQCDWMFSEWTDDSNIPPDEGDQGYDIQSSPSNPELLANAEAICKFISYVIASRTTFFMLYPLTTLKTLIF